MLMDVMDNCFLVRWTVWLS